MKLEFIGDSLSGIMDEICRAYGDYMKFGITKTDGGLAGSTKPLSVGSAANVTAPAGSTNQPVVSHTEAIHHTEAEVAVDLALVAEKRKAGRPKKATDIAVDAATAARVASPAPLKEEAQKEITKDQLIAALNAVFEKHDIDKARECLGKHSVSKIQELKPAQYCAFLETCQEAVA